MTGEGPGQTEGPRIITELNGAEAVIRINHPARRNALSTATLQELDAAVSAVIALSSISTIILTGTGDVFSSGANIREIQSLTPITAKEFARRGQRLFQKIADAPQQTIAAINGYCMGGGLDLALACDFRCASHNAVFAHPGAQLGIITGWGGTQRLPRLIGEALALEIFMTARRVSSREALEIGLVDRLGDSAIDCARELARTLSVECKES